MHGQHERTVLAIHALELLEPEPDHPVWIGDPVGAAVDVAVERRVVQEPLDRYLGQVAVRRSDEIWDVIAHQAAVVDEAGLLEQARRARVQTPGRRAVARRADTEMLLVDVELL